MLTFKTSPKECLYNFLIQLVNGHKNVAIHWSDILSDPPETVTFKI